MSVLIFNLTAEASSPNYMSILIFMKPARQTKPDRAQPTGKRDRNQEPTKEKILAAAL
jgi:hypothetical protein